MLKYLYILLVFVCVTTSAYSSDNTVKLTSGEWEPFITPRKPYKGVALDIIERAFDKSDYKVKWGFFPWGRAYSLAAHGTWDGTAIWIKTPERMKDYIFSAPVLINQEVLICNNSTKANWSSLEDLLPLRIGITMFSAHPYQQKFFAKNNREILQLPTYETIYKSLISNRIDCTILNSSVHQHFMETTFKDKKNAFFVAQKTFPANLTHLAISKRTKNAREIIKAFNIGLRELIRSGEYSSLINNPNLTLLPTISAYQN